MDGICHWKSSRRKDRAGMAGNSGAQSKEGGSRLPNLYSGVKRWSLRAWHGRKEVSKTGRCDGLILHRHRAG